MQCRKRKEIGCGKSAFSKTKVKEERGERNRWGMGHAHTERVWPPHGFSQLKCRQMPNKVRNYTQCLFSPTPPSPSMRYHTCKVFPTIFQFSHSLAFYIKPHSSPSFFQPKTSQSPIITCQNWRILWEESLKHCLQHTERMRRLKGFTRLNSTS